MIYTPTQYQIQAINAGYKALIKTGMALIDMATGLGKTVTSAFIAKKIKAKRVLFLVHNNFILTKAMETFGHVLTDKKMALFNGNTKVGAKEADFVFSTWQTMKNGMYEWNHKHFDLIVVDEAHHSEAETWKEVIKYFKGKRLALTATPDRMDALDIRESFGKEVFKLTLEEAIARGYLPLIEYHVITDNILDEDSLQDLFAEIKESRRKLSMDEINKRLFIRKRDSEIAAIINGYPEKAVVFCASIAHANRLAEHLALASTFHSGRKAKGEGAHESSASYKANQRVLDDLKNGVIRRVCAVNAFNEGVDVPSIGLVVFGRSTSSETIFRQQLGRGLRPGKDKLIVLDFVSNIERIQQVKKLMNDVADKFEEFFEGEERTRKGYNREKFEVSGKGFEFTFSDRIIDVMTELESLNVRDFYPTWQEASKAAINLKIESQPTFKIKYTQDRRLPSSPDYYYPDFPNWFEFLGKKKRVTAKTWRQASKIAVALNIKSSMEYFKRYKEDQSLRSDPKNYPDWPGWKIFLKTNHYKTWQEASAVAIKLKIKTIKNYQEQYKKDPQLPSSPNFAYPDFPDWFIFLGNQKKQFYPTWQECTKAVKRLRITTKDKYNTRYKENPMLPSGPAAMYPDFPGWKKFLGRK